MNLSRPFLLHSALIAMISLAGLSRPLLALDAGTQTTTFANAATDPRRATPDAAEAALKAGNRRFISNKGVDRINNFQRVAATANAQYPIASVIGCADSRTPPETIFDLGIGELFVCRVAGVASGINDVASLEYGSAVLGVPLIVVMGHSNCGAIKAAIAGGSLPGSLSHLIKSLQPAVDQAREEYPHAEGKKLLEAATREQVLNEVAELKKSAVLQGLIREGKLKIVGAVYSTESGKVTWLN